MKVLFLSSWFPYPPNNGSKIRVYNLIQALAEVHDVTLLSLASQQEGEIDVSGLQRYCQEIHIITRKIYKPKRTKALLGFLTLTPRSLVDTYSSEMRETIKKTLSRHHYDVVIASQLPMARYKPYFQNYPSVFEEVELGLYFDAYYMADSILSRLRNGLTWVKQIQYMKKLLKGFDAYTVVSENESEILQTVAPSRNNVKIIPNAIELIKYEGFKPLNSWENTLIFPGSFQYFPNYEAMKWFLETIFPIVQTRIPDLKLIITGDHRDLPLPAFKGVDLTGFVDEIRPLIARSNVCVAPIRSGGGTRLKILEAMALGTPVVSTTKGVEGLDVCNGEHLLVADTPEQFALAICKLLGEPELSKKISENAGRLIASKYDWAVGKSQFLALVENVGLKRKL